jgi:transposase
MMAPHVRRTWAPRGHTPILRRRGRARQKVSVIGALSISPGRHRVRGWFDFAPQANFDGARIVAFLQQLLRSLRVPVVLVWDRLKAHLGEPVRSWLQANAHRIHAEALPAYAPELNPVELIWGHAKTHTLANYAPTEFADLLVTTELTALSIGDDESLLRSLLQHCPLPMRLP